MTEPTEAAPAPQQSVAITMETSLGAVKIELWPDKAPITVKNFLDYVDAGFLDGTIFHRVIPGFVIQGGGFTADMEQKPTRAPIRNEATRELANDRGTISMARTQDPHSATSQFYINLRDNHSLNASKLQGQAGYCAFGRVVEGMDVVDKIAAVPTGNAGRFQDVPREPVTIKAAKRAP